jgi:hypothetical protein
MMYQARNNLPPPYSTNGTLSTLNVSEFFFNFSLNIVLMILFKIKF